MAGKTWRIPSDASKPSSKILENREAQTFLAILKDEMDGLDIFMKRTLLV